MPIQIGGGPQGYKDWQRVVNWDNPLDIDVAVPAPGVTGLQSYGPVSSARYGYLAGDLRVVTAPALVTLTWQAAAGGSIIGQRAFVLDPNITRNNMRIPHMGSQWSMTIDPGVGIVFRPQVHLFPTNRFHPLEFIPFGPLLVDQQAIGIGGPSTTHYYPASYYAGPMHIWTNATVAGIILQLEAETAVGQWDLIAEYTIASGSVNPPQLWTAPPGAWRLTLSNSGAAATVYLTATPSLTGAI